MTMANLQESNSEEDQQPQQQNQNQGSLDLSNHHALLTQLSSDATLLAHFRTSGSLSVFPPVTWSAAAQTQLQHQHIQHQQQQQLQHYLQALQVAATTGTVPAGGLVTHNLIPSHLQQAALLASSSSLHGTPGHQPALIANKQPLIEDPIPPPILTVQDRPMTPPVYNGVNPQYPGLRVLHTSPPIFCVDHFLTPFECNFLIQAAQGSFGPAPVVGKGAGEVSPSRTSSTCYLAREDLPDLMRKVSLLTGKPIEHCELPQVGRYEPSQQYLQHYDAFDLATEDGIRFASNGGQRTITVLIYLNDVARGGQTRFPALNLDVQPRQGMALIFFPATVDGLLDKMALHAALPAIDTKFVSQVWIRQANYAGQPSKRLPQTLGMPFAPSPASNTLPVYMNGQEQAQQLQQQQNLQLQLQEQQNLQHLQQQQNLQQLQQQQMQHQQQQQHYAPATTTTTSQLSSPNPF